MNVATISSSAVLVDLNISVWTGRKMDKQVSAEIDQDKGTKVRAGNYHKALMAGAPELEAINKMASAIRNWHSMNTIPWSDSGTRLIPTARLFAYKAELTQLEQDFNQLVSDFLNAYDVLVQAAQFRLGALFNADEYPPREVIESKFGIRYAFDPVQEAGDFRVDIGQQGLEELRQQFTDNRNRYVQDAMRDVWARVKDVVERLSRQLAVDKSGAKGRLYQSTLDGALELCEMLKSFNLTGDPDMEQTRKLLKMALEGVDVSELRKDDAVRESVKVEIDALLNKFSFGV